MRLPFYIAPARSREEALPYFSSPHLEIAAIFEKIVLDREGESEQLSPGSGTDQADQVQFTNDDLALLKKLRISL